MSNQLKVFPPMLSWHTFSSEEVARELDVSLSRGLNELEVAVRLQKNGKNEIALTDSRNALKILRDQILNPMILLLGAVVVISLSIGHLIDGIIVGVIVAMNIGIGFFQEFRAERALQSIRQLTVPRAKVLREGVFKEISAAEVVPGDIVCLESGDRIPADIRFVETLNVQVDESLVTGESVPVMKQASILHVSGLTLGDRINIGFMGTHMVTGRAVGICVATGVKTELGRIATLVSTEKPGEVPLKQRMDRMTRKLVLGAIVLCLIIFTVGVLHGEEVAAMALAAISLAIAAIPEGLPAVITISLSLGAFRMAKRGVLVRRLQAVEALGSITVICADKTGTLTENRMEVKKCEPSIPSPDFSRVLVLCNDAQWREGSEKILGDPMEEALLKWARSAGVNLEEVRRQWPRIDEIPFDTDRKRMTTVNRGPKGLTASMKGAPETVIPLCRADLSGLLTESRKWELTKIQEEMASQGLRVIALAMKTVNEGEEVRENNMTFLGLVALHDPPRKEAALAIAECRAAGIRPVMITGDHQVTAVAIGRELGIYHEGDAVITGHDLRREGRSLLDERAHHTSIFARVTPEDKLSIIQVLKDNSEYVAMTGDGVNDGPALKKADVGIAMGRGTDVAKEASALILVKENFSTIVRAVREGRVIYDNIRKFVRYMLTTNLGEIATMLLAIVLGLPIPLLPVQILWINLVTDGLPAIALGFEPAEGNVMARPPRQTKESILSRGLWQHTLWVGGLMGLMTIGVMTVSLNRQQGLDLARTLTFTTLTLAQMGHVLAIRSESRPLWRIGILSNYRLLVAVTLTILAQLALIFVNPLQTIFHTVSLSGPQVALCFIPAVLIYLLVEMEKKLRNRGGNQ